MTGWIVKFRRKMARSRFSRLAILPLRLGIGVRYLSGRTLLVARWLAASKEHTNFTYELTPLNRTHMAWFVAAVTGENVKKVFELFTEMEGDQNFLLSVEERLAGSPRRGIVDAKPLLGRRLGWYALVRILKPKLVVETGTDRGLGTIVLARALERNGQGRVVTIDINPESGALIAGPLAGLVDRAIGDSVDQIRELDSIDVFIHDSWHARDHEYSELEALTGRLSPGAVVLSDNSELTDALPTWAWANGRKFLYFQEEPARHWVPGGGIGVSTAVM